MKPKISGIVVLVVTGATFTSSSFGSKTGTSYFLVDCFLVESAFGVALVTEPPFFDYGDGSFLTEALAAEAFLAVLFLEESADLRTASSILSSIDSSISLSGT